MLSARVAAALARSLPRQAGVVSTVSFPGGGWAVAAARHRRRHLGGRGDIEGQRPPAVGSLGRAVCGGSPQEWVTAML